MKTVLGSLIAIGFLCTSISFGQTHVFQGESLDAIVKLGFTKRVPIGIEVTDWPALDQTIEVTWSERDPARAILARIGGKSSRLIVRDLDGVLWVHSPSAINNMLDVVIPEFKVRRVHLRFLEAVLYGWLKSAIDPSRREGTVGSIPTPADIPSVGPLDLRDTSIRGILSVIVAAVPDGGLWIADGNVDLQDSWIPPLWRIVSYREKENEALAILKQFRERRRHIGKEARSR